MIITNGAFFLTKDIINGNVILNKTIAMAQLKKKKKILTTPLNDLWAGIKLSGHVATIWTVMTVQEIFDTNQSLKGNKDEIKCFRDENGKPVGAFIKDSKKWRDLKTWLLHMGFTHKDWPMLLPETGTPKRFDISLLSKDRLKKLPFRQVCNIQPSGTPYDALADFIRPEVKNTTLHNRGDRDEYLDIPVHELLKVGFSEIEQIIKNNGGHRMNPEDVHGFRKTLCSMQEKLFGHGFTKKDGPFMTGYFGKKTTHGQMFLDLVCNRGVTSRRAKYIIGLASSVGLI